MQDLCYSTPTSVIEAKLDKEYMPRPNYSVIGSCQLQWANLGSVLQQACSAQRMLRSKTLRDSNSVAGE